MMSMLPNVSPHLRLSRRDVLRLVGLGLLAPPLAEFLTGGVKDSEAATQTYDATIADARATIADLIASAGGPNAVSVALVDDRQIIWAEAFGFIDQQAGRQPTTATLFGLASGSKILATIATMILVDRGLVDLDTPLVQYVPDFRMADDRYTEITIRMLLSHSSGLPGTDYRNGSTFFPVYRHVNQIQSGLAGQRLKHTPGEMAVYCNDGFSLIELLVKAVTGASYTDFVARKILRPLGMTRSRFGTETLPPRSYAATLNANGEPNPQEYINVNATGGVYTTPSEMGRLGMLLLNGGRLGARRLLSRGAIAEMGLDQSASLPLNPLHLNDYGLGWDSVRQAGLAAVGVTAWAKNGGSHYFASQFNVAPDERLAVMVMGTAGTPVGPLAERILLHALAERGSIAGVPEPLIPDPPPVIPTSEARLLAMTGGYAGEYQYRLEKQRQSLTLSLLFNGQWMTRITGLQRRQGGDWIADQNPDTALFIVKADGHRHLAQRAPDGCRHYEAVAILGQALAPLPPLTKKWQARVGQRWLQVNDPYSSYLALGIANPLLKLWQDPVLPGYLIASPSGTVDKALDPSASDERALWCGKVGARDLADVVIEERDGEDWVLLNSSRYRPLESVPALTAGRNAIAIGAEGLGEWRKLSVAAALTVSGANAWYLYDAQFNLLVCTIKALTFGALPDQVPAGAYLVVHGAPNATIGVTLTP